MPLNLCDFNLRLSMYGSAFPGREADALIMSLMGFLPAQTATMPSALLEVLGTSPRVAGSASL